jgi:hypothetical protein
VPHRVSAGKAPSLLLFPGGRNWVRTSDPSLVSEPISPALTRRGALPREDLGAHRA